MIASLLMYSAFPVCRRAFLRIRATPGLKNAEHRSQDVALSRRSGQALRRNSDQFVAVNLESEAAAQEIG